MIFGRKKKVAKTQMRTFYGQKNRMALLTATAVLGGALFGGVTNVPVAAERYEVELELYADGAVVPVETAYDMEESSIWSKWFRGSERSVEQVIYDGLVNMEETISLTDFDVLWDELGSISQDLLNSCSELFYVGGYAATISEEEGKVINLIPEYVYSGKELEELRQGYAAGMETLLSGVEEGWSDLEKVVYVHDYLCQNFEYDLTYSNYDAGVFFRDGKGVCQAYTMVFGGAMRALDIPVRTAASDAMNHIWNVVQLDGNWYHVDVTWDDPVEDAFSLARHNHLLVSDKGIQKARNTEEVHHDWACVVECTDKKYDFYYWMTEFVSSPFQYYEGKWYYVSMVRAGDYKSYLKAGNLASRGKIVFDLGSWFLPDMEGYVALNAFAGLDHYDGKLYFNGCNTVYVYTPTGGVQAFLTPALENQAVVGTRIDGNVLSYSLAGNYFQKGTIVTQELIPVATPTIAPTEVSTVTPVVTPTVVPTMIPTVTPTATPIVGPTLPPTEAPTTTPVETQTMVPTATPIVGPTLPPTEVPTAAPVVTPTLIPTATPIVGPTLPPTVAPTEIPTATPIVTPAVTPTMIPTATPIVGPTLLPTVAPTTTPVVTPTMVPTTTPVVDPTLPPTEAPTITPTMVPTATPTRVPTKTPTVTPTEVPTPTPVVTSTPIVGPTLPPTVAPTEPPAITPTVAPTATPVVTPTMIPTATPIEGPTLPPTVVPTGTPAITPTVAPTEMPAVTPTVVPTMIPMVTPTATPIVGPTLLPTVAPTEPPAITPTVVPTETPAITPTITPTVVPTMIPTVTPTATPIVGPTLPPTVAPTENPTVTPTVVPTETPAMIPTATPTQVPTMTPTVTPTATPIVGPTLPPTEAPTTEPVVPPTTEPSGMLGDVDGNGVVNLQDAGMTLRAALGIINLSEENAVNADLDRDGNITLNDTIIVLKVALGILVL